MNSFLEGKGVHTGEISSLKLMHTFGKNLQLNFGKFTNIQKTVFESPHFLEANYCTSIKDASRNIMFFTPEHFMACMYPWAQAEIKINCEASEMPGMDGSALIFSQFLQEQMESFGFFPQAPTFYTSQLKKNYPIDTGHFKVQPHTHFKVHYQVHRGDLKQDYVFEWKENQGAELFFREIAPARTFIFWDSYLDAKKKGLLKGAELSSGLLLAQNKRDFKEALLHPEFSENSAFYPILNSQAFRLKNECARHKILDLLGDLAWCGLALPKLEINILNGGHFHHLKLVKDLIYERVSAKSIG